MLATSLLFAVSALAASSATQSTLSMQSSATTSAAAEATTPAGGYTLTPAEIAAYNATIKVQWCTSQKSTCIQLCEPGGAYPNLCDNDTLDWTCTCNNGTSPDIGEYQQSVPAFLCHAYIAQCVLDTTVAAVQAQCMQAPCGNKIASNPVPPTSSSMTPTSTKATHSSEAAKTASTAAAATSSGAASAFGAGLDAKSGGIIGLGMLAFLGVGL